MMEKPAWFPRFESNIAHEALSGCWLWTGQENFGGYGRFYLEGKRLAAHRQSYELFKGPIPEGLTLDHLCRVRCCVNPDHLEPVTNRVNILRGVGATAKAAKIMYCTKGHPMFGENVAYYKCETGKRRVCITCDNARRALVHKRDTTVNTTVCGRRSNASEDINVGDTDGDVTCKLCLKRMQQVPK